MIGPIDGVPMVSVLVFLSCVSDLTAGKGMSFLVAFSKEPDNAYIYLTMLVRGQQSDVIVTTPKKQSYTFGNYSISRDDKFKSIPVYTSLVTKTSGMVSGNCVKIESTADISVITFTFALDDGIPYSGSSFMVLPLEQLSTYYIAVTSCRLTDCFILVASYENDAEVKVRVSAVDVSKGPPNQPSEIVYDGKTHKHGSVFAQKLQAWDSFQIVANATDLTGTLLSSNKPIAVYSGGVFGKALQGQKKDKMMEQIPPVKSLGKTFVLRGPDVPRAFWYTVRIAKPHPNTTVELSDNGNHHTVIEVRDDQEVFRIDVRETIVLKASNPILVVMEFPEEDGADDEDASVDPSFVLALPEILWINRVRLYIFIPVLDVHCQAVLVTSATCTQNFQVNNEDIADMHWNTAGDYKSGIFTLHDEKAAPRLSNTNCPFGGYVLTYGESWSWMYPFDWIADIADREEPGPDLQPLPDPQEDHSSSTRISSTPITSSISEIYLLSTTGTMRDTSQTVLLSTLHTTTEHDNPEKSPTTTNQAPDKANTESQVTSTPIHSVPSGIISTSTILPSGNKITGVSELTTRPTLESPEPQTSSTDISATPVSRTTDQVIQNPTTSSVLTMPAQIPTTSSVLTMPAQIPTTALSHVTVSSAMNESPSAATMGQSHPTQTFSQYLTSHTDLSTILPTSTHQYSIQDSLVQNTSISPEIVEKTPSSNSYTLVLCPCECTTDLDWIANLTTEEKEEQTQEIVRSLQVDKAGVSQTIRKKTSAPDKRASSTYYGSFITGLVFVSLFTFIVGSDFLYALYYIYTAIKQIK